MLRTRRMINDVLNATTAYVEIGQNHFVTLEQWKEDLINKIDDISTGFPIVNERRRILSSSSTPSYRIPTSPLPDTPSEDGKIIYTEPVFADLSSPYENIDKTKSVQSSDETADCKTLDPYATPRVSKNIQPEPEPESESELLEHCD